MKKLLALSLAFTLISPAFAGDVSNTGIANEGVTGTSIAHLAKLTTASPSTAIITTAGDTTGIIGVVTANAGTGSPNPTIAFAGQVQCAFDGTATAGHYVQNSASVNGDCHDTGATTEPTSGDTVGRVVIGGSGAGTYTVNLMLSPSATAGSGTVTNSGTLTLNNLIAGAGTTVIKAITTGANVLTALAADANATGGFGTVGTSGTNVGLLNASKTDSGANSFTGANSFAEAHGTSYAPTLTSNNYNAAITDCGKTLLLPTGTTPTVTMPNINPASGECSIKMVQMTSGTSLYTIVAASGGTIVSANSYTHTAKQYATIMLTLLTPSASAAVWGLAGEGS